MPTAHRVPPLSPLSSRHVPSRLLRRLYPIEIQTGTRAARDPPPGLVVASPTDVSFTPAAAASVAANGVAEHAVPMAGGAAGCVDVVNNPANMPPQQGRVVTHLIANGVAPAAAASVVAYGAAEGVVPASCGAPAAYIRPVDNPSIAQGQLYLNLKANISNIGLQTRTNMVKVLQNKDNKNALVIGKKDGIKKSDNANNDEGRADLLARFAVVYGRADHTRNVGLQDLWFNELQISGLDATPTQPTRIMNPHGSSGPLAKAKAKPLHAAKVFGRVRLTVDEDDDEANPGDTECLYEATTEHAMNAITYARSAYGCGRRPGKPATPQPLAPMRTLSPPLRVGRRRGGAQCSQRRARIHK